MPVFENNFTLKINLSNQIRAAEHFWMITAYVLWGYILYDRVPAFGFNPIEPHSVNDGIASHSLR